MGIRPCSSLQSEKSPARSFRDGIDNVGRFLRGINAVFSAAIAIKRIDTELAIIAQFHNNQIAIQRRGASNGQHGPAPS